jgi:nucleotide-binding universal stress UspA family protein
MSLLDSGGFAMTQSALVQWSDPKLILIVTNLVEDHTFMLHAIHQATLSRAKVLLVHVIPPHHLRTEAVYGTTCGQPSLIARNAKAKLDELAVEFEWEGIECEPILLNGLPEEQIPLLAKSRVVDRILVASRVASGIERLIGSSVAEALIAGVEIPVCTIGRHLRPRLACAIRPERILLATSLQPESSTLVSFASTLAELHHAQLTLLHVLESVGMDEQERELSLFNARRKLSWLIPKEATHRHQPVFLVSEGDPKTVISDVAGSSSQDLIILGGTFPSLISWILGTSVVHRVIVEAKCPVITIKSRAGVAAVSPSRQDAIGAGAAIVHSTECNEETVPSR